MLILGARRCSSWFKPAKGTERRCKGTAALDCSETDCPVHGPEEPQCQVGLGPP